MVIYFWGNNVKQLTVDSVQLTIKKNHAGLYNKFIEKFSYKIRKIFGIIIIIILIFSNYSYAVPQQNTQQSAPQNGPPSVSAQSAIVMDASSGRILFEKNAFQKRPMASTTKIMTAIVALENGNLNDIITVSPKAARIEGSSIWLAENETLTLEDALYGLLMKSGNDAATAIAEHIGGGSVDNFAAMMNAKAKEIGAVNTSFKNPHGLDANGHYTTAYDLALIARYGLTNIPKFAEIVKTKETKIPWQGHDWDRYLKNSNKLLWAYPGTDGVKTGFTKKAGRCLVSSTTKNGWQLVAVTLNDGDDWNDHKKMMDYAFSTYKPKLLFEKNQFLKTVMVKNGKRKTAALETQNEVILPLLDGEETKIRLEYDVPDYIEAPVSPAQTVGMVTYYIGNERIGNVKLKPSEYIERINVKESLLKVLENWIMMFEDEPTI